MLYFRGLMPANPYSTNVQAGPESVEEIKNRSLEEIVTRFVRIVNTGQVGGMLLIKLDLHDRIGTSFGRAYTQKFCKKYAEKLRRFLPEGAIVLRLSSRRIAVAIVRSSVTQVIDVASSIMDRVEPRIQLGTEKFTVDASMGVALYPTHADDAESLLRRAELALQHAIDAGLSFQIYEPGASGFQKALWKFETELKQAIRDGHLEVHYQPKYSVTERRLNGVEALVRWRNQSGDLVPASEFVPAAERSGAITDLTWLVFDEVAKAAPQLKFVPRPFSISINVPAKVLIDTEFFDRLARARHQLMQHHISLVVELTEDSLMKTDTASLEVLMKIRSNSVGLAIDDFGKGYSSLNYLRQIPATELKIDRDFVRTIAENDKDKHIVQTAIELADAFDMQSTAEGVDSIEVLDELVSMKCAIVQGYYVGRPMTVDALERWFRGNAVARLERAIAGHTQRSRGHSLGHLASRR